MTDDKPEDVKPVDIIEKCIGVLGKWHIWICIAVMFCKFPIAWHQLSMIFLAAPMQFTCIDNTTDRCSTECPEHIFDRSIFKETIATEWDLVCGRQYLSNLAQTFTMLGILVGNLIFGYFSDRFGRKAPLVWAVILQTISGIAVAYSPWYSMFVIMKFINAAVTGGAMVISFVLVMELVGTEWRTFMGIIYQIPFNFAHLTMPLISYFLRDWHHFQIAISIPSLVLVSYYWVLPESPRWLLTGGQKDKAVQILQSAAKSNGLPTEDIEQKVETYLKGRIDSVVDDTKKGNVLDLVRTPVIRVYTLCICFNWGVCGLGFFGLAQFCGNLAGDIFINVALSAVITVPATFIAIYTTKQFGRKKSLIFGNVCAGVSLLLIAIVPAHPVWYSTVLATIGMFGIAISFPTVYIYSGELFPTALRNIGVGTSSMTARIGSMVAPFVAGLTETHVVLPPIIFGSVALIGAALCLVLPETLGCKLPDTVEEAEQFKKQQKLMKSKNKLDGAT